jgi:uncharacterized paraquat-inducible protein A
MAKVHDDDDRYGSNPLMESGTFDLAEDIQQAKLRGLAVLGTLLLCAALFIGGLAMPLVEVIIFPGSPDMEKRLVKSVWDLMAMSFSGGHVLTGLIVLACTLAIPLALFAGTTVIMYENFFAIGFGYAPCFKPATRALIVSCMYIGSSYQVVMVFLVTLFSCFFSGLGSEISLRTGFHLLSLYFLLSIGLVQAMEYLRLDAAEERFEAIAMDEVTGFNLRRRFSSFFPSLPGIKETFHVDAFQVFFFATLFLILLVMGFDQPLLDVRVTYQGVALLRRVQSMRDIIFGLSQFAPFWCFTFVLLVVGLPVLYCLLLVMAGVLDTVVRWTIGEQETLYECTLLIAKIMRPWVMIDVFSIALSVALYAVQTEYVSATIPDGIINVGPTGIPTLSFSPEADGALQAQSSRQQWVHFFSGMYLIVGAGIATMSLRWFWSSSSGTVPTAGTEELHERHLEYNPVPPRNSQSRSSSDDQFASSASASADQEAYEAMYEESAVTRYAASKSCRCLVVWTVVCLILHGRPPQQRNFRLASMNEALNNALPVMNTLLAQYAPDTVGNCQYPWNVSEIPQPCFNYGILDEEIQSVYRITAEWMSGLRGMNLTSVNVDQTQALAIRQPVGASAASPTVIHRFALTVSGIIAQPKLFLRIEECPKNHTTLLPITGQGLCKPFLDSGDSCCEPNRKFALSIAAECELGANAMGNLQVQDMWMDTMTVKPEMTRGRAEILIADKNITKMVLDNVKGNLMYYLTQQPLMKISGQEVNLLGFLNRVLSYNAPHQEFRCF